MDFNTYFLVYLILYRLSVITAGIVCVTLGYRMFCKGLWPDSKSGGNELTAEIGGMKFFLKNGAPGTFFALFGIIIISAMIITGAPEYTRHILNKSISEKSGEQDKQSKPEKTGEKSVVEEKIMLKGDSYNSSDYSRFMEKAKAFEINGQIREASLKYQEAISVASEAMNNLAWIYLNTGDGKLEDALQLSKMAVKYNSADADYCDTLSGILFKKGEYQDALQAKTRAAELDEKFKNGMKKFEDAVK